MLFTVSAIYHRGTWSPRVHDVLKRFDHSNIYVLIAGSCTPFAILLLYGFRGWALILFLTAGITDLFDGLIARRTGQKTTLGAWLDPMADKAQRTGCRCGSRSWC